MIADWKDYRQMSLGLVENGYIPVFGEFCPELEEIVVECILMAFKKGKKTMTLLINSYGGKDNSFNGIKAAMTMTGIQFTGLVMSRASSNGFRLLQHCHKRQAIRNAMLMFHWGQWPLGNSELAALLAGQNWPLDLLLEARRTILQEVHQRTGVSIDQLTEFALYERFFTAEQALQLNFIDKVIDDIPTKMKHSLPHETE